MIQICERMSQATPSYQQHLSAVPSHDTCSLMEGSDKYVLEVRKHPTKFRVSMEVMRSPCNKPQIRWVLPCSVVIHQITLNLSLFLYKKLLLLLLVLKRICFLPFSMLVSLFSFSQMVLNAPHLVQLARNTQSPRGFHSISKMMVGVTNSQ